MAVLAALLAGRAVAATHSWTGAADTNWSNPLNWSPPDVPAASDDLTFPSASSRRNIVFDMPAGTSVGPMSILGDYSFSGNRMTLTGDLSFNGACVFDNDLTAGASLAFRQALSVTLNGALDVNGKTLSFVSTNAAVLNGPLAGSGTINAGARGLSFVGGGPFSGHVEGYAFIGGYYPNASFHGPWITGHGTAGAVAADSLSPGVWRPEVASDPHSVGWINSGSVSITSQYSIDIQPEGNREQMIVTGPVSIAGKLTVTMVGTYPAIDGMEFPIIDNQGSAPVSGTFSGLPEGATLTAGRTTFWISYKGGDGNDVVLTAGTPAKTWTGANSEKWSDPANWQPQGVPTTGQALLFPPCCSARATTTNDLPAGFNPGTITFNGNYTLGGNLLTLTNDLNFANSGFTASLTCSAPLKLGSSIRFGPGQSTVFSGAIDMTGKTLTVAGYDAHFRGPISGSGAIVATGPGLTLEGSGSFSGPVSGIVNIVGSYPNATANGARTSGEGTLGAVTAGTISAGTWTPSNDSDAGGPPHQAATLHTGALSLSSKLIADIDAAAGVYDQVKVTGSVSLAGTLQLFFITQPSPGQSWTLIDNDGTDAVNGTFSGLPEGATLNNGYGTKQTLRITYKGGDGNDVVLSAEGGSVTSATATAIAQDRDTTEHNQPVTFTATVTSANGTPTGVVAFLDGSTSLGSVPLQNGSATLTTKALDLGDHSITASYAGNNSFAASSSAALVHHVVKGNPHVTLTPSSQHPAYGDGVAFSVNVAGSDATPTGSVSIAIDRASAGTATLMGGNATINVPLIAAGAHSVDVAYSGDAAFNSTSANSSLTVAKAATTIAIESPVNPSPAGVGVTLKVRVSAHASPDGNVIVSRGGRAVAQGQLAGGAASVRLAPFASGDQELTASYSGNDNFAASSATLMQHVAAPALSIADATLAHDDNIQVELSAASKLLVGVDYRTVDGSARAGIDYAAAQGTLTFAPGQTSATIPIRIPANALPAPRKSFSIELTNASGASILASRATMTIVRDDPPPYRTPVAYTYDSADGVPLRATLYAPAAGSGPWPLILWIPGDTTYDAEASDIAALRETARGYAVVSIGYRPAATAPFPAQIDDLGAAVRWLRANA
ncbi:MAG TPA: Ig-like domain repeat protein, partial [Thermoanaerobaculia bacterium]|nr:Ig-like domain repeat protein [Thermoanaerobaculia bacterium]